jgi:hypothetical protein
MIAYNGPQPSAIIRLGTALAYCCKAWLVDRMVWLYEKMKDAPPEYRGWLY